MVAFVGRRSWLGEEGLRLDAGAYASGGLAVRDQVRNGSLPWLPLSQVARVFYENRFARVYVTDPSRGTPFLGGADILLSDLRRLRLLSNARTPQMSQLLVESEWTLMSRSGTIGRTAFVRHEMLGMAASDDIIRLAPRFEIARPGYVFAFLSSGPAQAMIKQRTYGSVIQHIEPHHIADIPVPLLPEPEQHRIHNLVSSAADKRTEASRLLDEACAYFDALAGSMPSKHDHDFSMGLVRRKALNGRLDAFYHVGWAAESQVPGAHRLGDIADVRVPGRMKLISAAAGAPFFTGVDLYQTRPVATKRIAKWLPGFDDLRMAKHEILVQVDGQRYGLMGRPTYVTEGLGGAAASWHLARISTSETGRLFSFFRSEAGRRAVVRQSFGTSVPSITAGLLRQVCVPELPKSLVHTSQRSLELREQADREEEQAIREVERWLG